MGRGAGEGRCNGTIPVSPNQLTVLGIGLNSQGQVPLSECMYRCLQERCRGSGTILGPGSKSPAYISTTTMKGDDSMNQDDSNTPLPGQDNNGETGAKAGAGMLRLFLNGIIFMISAYISIVSISEITARQELCRIIDSKVRLLADQLAKESSPNASNGVVNRVRQITNLGYIRDRLEVLAVAGAGGRARTTRDLINDFIDNDREAENIQREPNSKVDVLDIRLARLNSDYLLALALVSVGLCGGLIGWFRQELKIEASIYNKTRPKSYAVNPSNMLLGLAAGFLVLLSIKGGKAVFIIDHRADLATFNPYSSSLVALLAGLYSDKAFRLLTGLVGTFEDRFKVQPKPPVGEGPHRA